MTTHLDLTVDYANVYVQGYGFDTVQGVVAPDDRHSQAQRVAINDAVFSLDAMENDISSQRTNFGDEHPEDSSLVLQKISGTLTQGLPAQYDALYVPKRVGALETHHDFTEQQWHKNPDGTEISAGKDPNYRIRRIVTQEIRFRHFYYQVARPTFNSANIETINNGSYAITLTVGGVTETILSASAKELVYGTPKEEQHTFGDTSLWIKDFVFHYRKGGWIGTRRKADGSVEEFDMYSTSTFPAVP